MVQQDFDGTRFITFPQFARALSIMGEKIAETKLEELD